MSEIVDRLKTALADRYAIEHERDRENRLCPRDSRASQTWGSDTTPSYGFSLPTDRLIPSVAVGCVTVLVTVSQFQLRLENAAVPAAQDRGFGLSGGANDRPVGRQTAERGTNRPVPGMRATGGCPGTLIPLAGRLQYQGDNGCSPDGA